MPQKPFALDQQVGRGFDGSPLRPLRSEPTPAFVSRYANRVEVERGEHDAVLTFYRDRNNNGSRLCEVCVPLSVLDRLIGE